MTGRVTPEMMRQHLRMYLVLGSVNCIVEPSRVVQDALAGGTTMVQFREKGQGALVGEPMIRLARRIQAECRQAGVPFIVNDDVELALKLNADGVHIGQDDESAASVRERIGNRILGVSAHSVEKPGAPFSTVPIILASGRSIRPARRMMPRKARRFFEKCAKLASICRSLGLAGLP